MNNLFRFILLRPPETRSVSESIQTENSPFVEKIRQAGKGANPVEEIGKVLDAFLRSAAFAKEVSSLIHFQHFTRFVQFLSATADLSVEKVNLSITSIFNKTAAELITDEGLLEDKRRIQETLIALRLKNESLTVNLALLKQFACAIDLIEHLANLDQSPIAEPQLRTILQRQIVVPDEINLPGVFRGPLFPEPDPTKKQQRLEKKRN